MSVSYYALVASFQDYRLDAESQKLNIKSILSDIEDAVSAADMEKVRLLYMKYDCSNLVSLYNGGSVLSNLGLLTIEEAKEELKTPVRLPEPLGAVIEAFSKADSNTGEDVDTAKSFGNQLFKTYYKMCSESGSAFLREYTKAEQMIGNLIAGMVLRKHSISSDSAIVGDDDAAEIIRSTQASDFGVRGEFQYTDEVIQIMNDVTNVVEREHLIDQIKWRISEELSQFSYFNMDAVLAYLVRVNLIVRWMELDEKKGNEMLDRLIGRLSAEEKIKKI